MKKLAQIFFFLLICNLSIAQSTPGLLKLIHECDFIVKGRVSTIDTLNSTKKCIAGFKCYSAEFEIHETLKGNFKDTKVELPYQATGETFTYPINPILGQDYILFLKYKKKKNGRIDYLERFKLQSITQANEKAVMDMIVRIVSRPELNQCQYFDLLLSNLHRPIPLMNRDLGYFSKKYDSLEGRFCIDLLDKKLLFAIFVKTHNFYVLPFLGDYNIDQVDAILIERISKRLNVIENSKNVYNTEAITVQVLLYRLSYLKNEEAHSEIYNLREVLQTGENKKFINQVNEILKKYEK